MAERKGLYIQMFSIHGLVRAENMEMGRDADTGGQIKYVVELGRHLSRHPAVARVDLFTRLISDRIVSGDYSVAEDPVEEKFRIVRVQCGGKKYMRKELLWPHLDEYIDKTIKFIKRGGMIPDVVHGHYADAGYVAMHLSSFFGVPLVFTGHSLGRSKLVKLLGDGMRIDDIVRQYKIDARIMAEESVIAEAELVVTSTSQEVEVQYGAYENRKAPRYRVIPPGVDIEKFYPYYHDLLGEKKNEPAIEAHASIIDQLKRFFKDDGKPLVLALSRPDKRKNIAGLIQAYGEDLELQAMANLAVFAGIRKDIAAMEENEREVLTEMLLLMDKYDLYGRMAIPKKHDFAYEVPELYRVAASLRGVFVNPALTEPFGLTLIEASASGLPIVVTDDGGPRDIVANCKNGVIVDVGDPRQIAGAVKKIIVDGEKWKKYSSNGIRNVRKHYTWDAHVESYMEELRKLVPASGAKSFAPANPKNPVGKRLAALNSFLVTDIDNTLIGDDNARLDELLALLKESAPFLGFGVATGRTVESTVEYLGEHGVPSPDVIISSVGTEIYYGGDRMYDQGWDTHIAHDWNCGKIREILDRFPFLEYQEEETQRKFKVSYFMDPGKDRINEIHAALNGAKLRYNLIYSHDQFLDVLPLRASKGKAIRYLSYKWEINLENIMVCGDSGNDEEMLRGEPLGVVVGGYSAELERLRGLRNIFFADRCCAGGILEGMEHYRFIEKAKGG
ncbi:MAG TPA: HAD-IIB family hydrolase [Spirochaetota bacterium]|nr:HAD-IIB family hydrolase [Spirochaetota bacterium]